MEILTTDYTNTDKPKITVGNLGGMIVGLFEKYGQTAMDSELLLDVWPNEGKWIIGMISPDKSFRLGLISNIKYDIPVTMHTDTSNLNDDGKKTLESIEEKLKDVPKGTYVKVPKEDAIKVIKSS